MKEKTLRTASFSFNHTFSWFFISTGCHDFFIFKSPPPIFPTLPEVQSLKKEYWGSRSEKRESVEEVTAGDKAPA